MKKRGIYFALFVIGLFLCLTIVVFYTPVQAQEKPIKWKLNTVFRSAGYVGEGVTWFCDEVKRISNGKLVIEPNYAASLGLKATEALSVIKNRLVDVNDTMLAPVAGEEPLASFNELAFLFQGDYEKAWKFATMVFWPEWKKIAESKWNAIAIGPYMLGDIDIYSKKQIRNLQDLKGLKIRTGSRGPVADGLTAIGAEPFLIKTSELYTALQRGMIDACVTTEVSATEAKLWEVLNYDLRTKMSFIVCCELVNKDSFNELPQDLRKVILDMDERFKEYMKEERRKMIVEFRKSLVDNGIVEINPSEQFLHKMREMCKPYWEKYVDKTGPIARGLLKKAKQF